MRLKRFDYKLKDNSKRNSIIVASIIVLVLIIGVTIYATYAAYKVTNTYNIIQGKVAEFNASDLAINVKVYDLGNTVNDATDFPSKDDYYYDPYNSYCESGSTITFDETTWKATINVSEKDKCTIAFNKTGLNNVFSKLQATYGAKESITELDVAEFETVTADGEYGMYKALDDLGTSYYLRGDVENNYVQFGSYVAGSKINGVTYESETPMYWRIVRINGDGTIRLIYDGVEKFENGTNHTATIGTSIFNSGTDDAKYMGYTYDVDGSETDSAIKIEIDNWYNANLAEKYGQYIVDGTFCNDRTTSETDIGYYAAYTRMKNDSPSLICLNPKYKYSQSKEIGNGLLRNSIGLLAADEAAYAGGIGSGLTNEWFEKLTYYLYTGDWYWTMTPYKFTANVDTAIDIYTIDGWGRLSSTYLGYDHWNVPFDAGVRPVINLRSNMLMYGDGSITNPFRLSE